MKKIITLILALLLMFPFASCKKEPTTDVVPITYEIKKHTEDVIWDEKDTGDVTLLYPEFEGMSEANKLIFDIIKRKCDESLPNLSSYETGSLPEVTYVIDSFSITYLSDTFLSAKIEGMLTVSLAAHPNPFIYAINVDLEELREISSVDILGNFDKIKELFTNGRFTLEKGIDDLNSQMSFEDMIMQYRSEYEIYPQIYLSSNKFYMNIELVYALGSNAVFSIDLNEVKSYLNTGNKEISKIIDQRKK